jgi:hypothetical protein
MDSGTKWLIAGAVYILGALGMFISRFLTLRHSGSIGDAGVEAAISAVIWPVEVLRLLF